LTEGRGAAAASAEHQGCGQAAPPRLVSPPLRFVSRPLSFVSRSLSFVSRPLSFVSRRRRLWGVGGPLGAVQRAPQWASLEGRRFGTLPRVVLALSWACRSVRPSGRYAPPAGRARAQHGARSGARSGAQPLAHGGESASDGGGGLMGAIRGHQRSSEVISGHQRSSVCIKAHQRVHQRPSVRQSEAIRGLPAQRRCCLCVPAEDVAMAQAVLATDAPADGRPDCPSHQADCPPHQADCLSPPQRGKRERLHAAVAGHVSVPEAMPRTLRLQAHSPDEGGNQGSHRHALGAVAVPH